MLVDKTKYLVGRGHINWIIDWIGYYNLCLQPTCKSPMLKGGEYYNVCESSSNSGTIKSTVQHENAVNFGSRERPCEMATQNMDSECLIRRELHDNHNSLRSWCHYIFWKEEVREQIAKYNVMNNN